MCVFGGDRGVGRAGGGQGEWEFVLHAQIRDQIMSTGGGVTKIYFPVI